MEQHYYKVALEFAIAVLQEKLDEVEKQSKPTSHVANPPQAKPARRPLSAEARKRIAAAQKKRWAEARKKLKATAA